MERPGSIRFKTEEELAQQVGALTARFTFDESLQPSHQELEDVIESNEETLKADYPARYEHYLELLRKQRNGQLTQGDSDRAELWFGMMNAFAETVHASGLHPEASLLYLQQLPVMKSLYGFLEHHGKLEPRGYVRLPTGTGKTFIFGELIRIMGLRTLIVTPKQLLTEQTSQDVEDIGQISGADLDIGSIYQATKEAGADVTVTTYASFVRQSKMLPEERVLDPTRYDLVILDEAHHALAPETRRALRFYDHAIQIGFTATPNFTNSNERVKTKELASILPHLIHEMSFEESVRSELLCAFQVGLLQTEVDLSSVNITNAGEYDAAELERAINIHARNLSIVELHKQCFRGQQAVAYCSGISHAEALTKLFQEHGVDAGVVHSDMSQAERKRVGKRLRLSLVDGGYEVVCNVGMLTEGFNQPYLSVCYNATPTLSAVRSQQRGGRVMRHLDAEPDKCATIIEIYDRDYRLPPVIFSDPQIADSARLGPQGFAFGESFVAQNGNIFGYARLISNPSEVVAVSEAIALDYINRGKPPKDWMNATEISDDLRLPLSLVKQAIQKLAHDEGRWYEERSSRYALPDRRGTMIYHGPEVKDRLPALIEAPTPAPGGWRTTSQIAAIYGVSQNRSLTMLKRIARDKPDEFGLFSPHWSKPYTRFHFGPEAQKLFAAHVEQPFVDTAPPTSWENEEDFNRSFGKVATAEALRYVLKVMPGLRESHTLDFIDPNSNIPTIYYSPQVRSQMDRYFTPPHHWQTMTEVAKELGVPVGAVRATYNVLPEKLRFLESRTCVADGKKRRYFAPKIMQAIKRKIERDTELELGETVYLTPVLEAHQAEPSWVDLGDISSPEIRELISALLENAYHVRSHLYTAEATGKIARSLLEQVEKHPRRFAIPADWYHLFDVVTTFGLDEQKTQRVVDKLSHRYMGQGVIRKFQVNGTADIILSPDMVGELLGLLKVA